VNGKAIVYGLRLSSMDASDMIDVLHYFFEEDALAISEIHAETRSQIRKGIMKSYTTPLTHILVKDPKHQAKNRGVMTILRELSLTSHRQSLIQMPLTRSVAF
jgi:hypothetical protein